ncbi:MAG: hypothetical protein Ta2G_17380 [Termitinemataceae bacterium]|nr:MAG: hypothetical protein Ta2G_17380 [Termitinemataceae bacterium]
MKFIITVFYFIILATHICFFIFKSKKYRHEKAAFVKYLYANNDMDTLYSIGVVRKDGFQESRRVNVTSVEDRLFEKYKQTKEMLYLDFYDIVVKYVKYQVFFIVFFLIETIAYSIFLELYT